MKVSRDGAVPQVEPEGAGRRWLIRLGGAKRLFQRAGGFVMQPITMLSAMTGAWATYAPLRQTFLGSEVLFFGSAAAVIGAWMLVYYALVLSAEQAWGQTQSQRAERSPLKRDTEELLRRTDHLETDGGTNE